MSCTPGSSNRERREGGADLLFDHGCQYFTVKDPSIQSMVDRWLEAGIVADWTGCFGTLDARNGKFVEVRNGTNCWPLPPFFKDPRGSSDAKLSHANVALKASGRWLSVLQFEQDVASSEYKQG